MEKSYFLSATFNEVVFKDRNKIYGAYQLRRVYGQNIKLAVICATVAFTGLLFTPLIKNKFFSQPKEASILSFKDARVIELINVLPEIEKPIVEKQVAVASKEKVKTEVYTEPKIVPNDAKVEEKTIANQEDLRGAAFGNQKVEGIALATPDLLVVDEAPTGLDAGTNSKGDSEIFIHAEEMPEFSGGEKAMMQYISRKINYPSAAQRENIQGLVVVTFVIAPNGEIRDAKILKGLGYGTDEEALRVVSGMPKWKPGKQNGKPVAVRYTLPIRFSMR